MKRTTNKPSRRKARGFRSAPRPEPLKLSDLTDYEITRRFAERHSSTTRYCPEWKSWLTYDGKRWRRDGTLGHERAVKETVRSLRESVARIRDSAERNKFETTLQRCESVKVFNAILRLAQSEDGISIPSEALDRQPLLLNCLNGTLDLRTGELHPHRPDDYLTKLTRVAYRSDASCPAWEGFLNRIMDGDAEMVAYLQRVAGYALTGRVDEHALFFLYGHGRNGKSRFLNALLYVMHDYGMTAPTQLLTGGGSSEHPTTLADLEGMRLVAVSEPREGRMDEALVKHLTGGDAIRARRMRQDYAEFQPTHKLLLASNHKPRVVGQDEGFWRRIHAVTFPVTIGEAEEDKDLEGKLHAEAEGILAWMVRGCLEWQRGGMRPPASARQATKDYRDGMDPVKRFVDAQCAPKAEARCRTSILHKTFLGWCQTTKTDPGESRDHQAFARALERLGFTQRKISTMHTIGLKPEPEVEAASIGAPVED